MSLDNKYRNFVHQRLIQNCLKFIVGYLEKRGFHGLNYLAKSNIHCIEVLFWIILLIVSTTSCVIVGQNSWYRYQYSSTVVTMENNHRDWNYSFPSVTICTKDVIDLKKLDNFVSFTYNFTSQADSAMIKTFLLNVSEMSLDNFIQVPDNMVTNLIDPKTYTQLIFNMILNPRIGQKQSILIKDPKTNPNKMNNNDIPLTRTVSELGICYTSQNLILSEMQSSHWGDKSSLNENETLQYINVLDLQPIESIFTGYDTNVSFVIHSALEVPGIWDKQISATINDMLLVYIFGEQIVADSDFKENSNIKQRHCRFPDESNLKSFQKYTFALCRQECRMRYIFELCKCVPHYYRINVNTKYSICGPVGINCLFKNKETIRTLRKNADDPFSKITCKCLPNCLEGRFLVTKFNFQKQRSLNPAIYLRIDEFPLIRYKRQIFYSFQDLIVSIGGTTGFFLGCSILSFIELFYYFTIRLYFYSAN